MSSDEPIYVGSDSEDGAGSAGAGAGLSSEDLAFSNEDGGAYGGSGDDSDASSMDDDDYGGDMGEPVISTRQVRERKGKRCRSEWSASRRQRVPGAVGGRRLHAHPFSLRRCPQHLVPLWPGDRVQGREPVCGRSVAAAKSNGVRGRGARLSLSGLFSLADPTLSLPPPRVHRPSPTPS